MTNPNPSIKEQWQLKGHSYQIADTGDYDGYYEITNGKVSIFTKDDDDEALEPVVKALNDSGCKFYLDDAKDVENYILRHQAKEKEERIQELEKEKERLTELLEIVHSRSWNAGASQKHDPEVWWEQFCKDNNIQPINPQQ